MTHEFDTTIRPQDNFFGYVNNSWLRKNPIPASESSWGTFYVLRDQSWKAVYKIIEQVMQSDTQTHDESLLQSFFGAAMEFDLHQTRHQATLERELTKIDEIKSVNDVAYYLGYAHKHGFNMLFAPYVDIDDKNSRLQVLRFVQRGLGMPNRDYYLEKSEKMDGVRAAYDTFYESLCEMFKPKQPNFKAVYELEYSLAEASWTDVELRDVEKNYTRFTLAELKKNHPKFDWDAYFKGLGWNEPSDNIVVGQPSFINASLALIDELPLEQVKQYMSWRLMSGASAWLSQQSYDANFAFYETALSGVIEQKPLWKRAVMMADSFIIGEALGKQYAKDHFPESSKLAVRDMVEDIRVAYRKRIASLTWMKDDTKQRAFAKLDNMKVFVGYPTVWRDTSKLSLSADNVIENILLLRAEDSEYELAKVGNPPAAEEWEMNAHTVNAYHHPNRLEIVFPAAILQPPFYDPAASYASNIGGIGAVIGHEFTHGFDDQGAQFDEYGNVKSWQTDEERAEFDRRAQLIVEQADAFETVPGTFLQGKLVLGEAIADIGGLQLAVEALDKTNPDAKDFTELFTTFAKAECGTATEERLVQLAKIDPHPPSPFRVNHVVNHIDTFYETYDVTDSDKLYLPSDKRAQIW